MTTDSGWRILRGDYIMTRAADMGIRVISSVHDMDEAEFAKELSMKIR